MEDLAPGPRRRWLRWVGTLLSLALLGWMLSRQDWQAFQSYAARIPAMALGGALAAALGSQAWSALRWWVLLRSQRVPVGYLQAFRLNASGLFTSNFLPGTIGGDVVRIAGILPRCPDRAVGVASVVLDRVVGVTAMLFALPLSLATFWPTLTVLLAPSMVGGIPHRLKAAGERLLEIASPWLARPQSVVGALLASGAGVLSYWICLWILAAALQMPVTLLNVAGVTGITYFLSQIPISINGFGVREAAMIALYGQLGASPEQAAALALISRVVVMLATVPGAFWLPGFLPAARAERAGGAE